MTRPDGISRVLIDINVVIDVLLDRPPGAQAAAVLLSLCERKEIDGLICAASVSALLYILEKALGPAAAKAAVKDLLRILRIATTDEATITSALDADWRDTEDAIVHESAKLAEATHIVTRNIKDFGKAELTVCAPETLLTLLSLGLQSKRQ